MGCSRGKASPDSFTKTKLFALSGGYCQRPECNENLFKSFDETEIHIAEIAHIISVNEGPRSNRVITATEKGAFENLILLCPNCHTTIDKAEKDFPDHLIRKWKDEHEQRLNDTFGIKTLSSRAEVANLLEPIFLENKFIFDKYGPETEERFNPESQMPKIWIKKIREVIIPNNRQIERIIRANYRLMTQTERNDFVEFIQHINDFEAKHIFNFEGNGMQFPKRITQVYV
jgi:5-methylcytosine-specific restriction endonuclease McrA